jgi:Flp pilus assembly protein TadG
MRKIYFRNLRKFSTAQAMVEFLIVLPVMLLLVMGILQFSFIYQAKITLNYAAFQTARAGSLNNASISAMDMAFASNMAPLYTSSYLSMGSSGECSSSFLATDAARQGRLSGAQIMDSNTRGVLEANINNFNSESVLCARRIVQQQIDDGYVNITVVNPSPSSFTDYGVSVVDEDGGTQTQIPNDNLMYRDANVVGGGASAQTIQDANLLKVHIGYCYELIVPFVDRIIWAIQRYGTGSAPASETAYGRYWPDPDSTPPGFFGPPASGSFAESCISNPADNGRYSIVLYSQGIMRMQSAAIECELDDTCG